MRWGPRPARLPKTARAGGEWRRGGPRCEEQWCGRRDLRDREGRLRPALESQEGRARGLAVLPPAAPGLGTVAQAIGVAMVAAG